MKAVRVSSLANDKRGEFIATWMLVSENEAFFWQPEVANRIPARRLCMPGMQVWTDDYSSLLPVLRW